MNRTANRWHLVQYNQSGYSAPPHQNWTSILILDSPTYRVPASRLQSEPGYHNYKHLPSSSAAESWKPSITMSSRFVSSGRIDAQTGDTVPSSGNLSPTPPALSSQNATPAAAPVPPSLSSRAAPAPTTTTASKASTDPKNTRTAEWAAVQASLESRRQAGGITSASANASASVSGGGGQDSRSLYEVLQANKAAKQAAFEEANKIKNQFRPLDEDDVEFLDQVRERKRAEERRARREEEEGLEGFRRAQGRGLGAGGEKEEVEEEEEEEELISDETVPAGGDAVVETRFHVVRRRQAKKMHKKKKEEEAEAEEQRENEKSRQDSLLKGIKRKAPSTAAAAAAGSSGSNNEISGGGGSSVGAKKQKGDDESNKVGTSSFSSKGAPTAASSSSDAKPNPKLSLVDYGSDDDDDDDD